jgi:hypothetical protein
MAPGLGAEFAGYRIEPILGRGGVGPVHLAEDLTLPRQVALKILRAEYAGDPQFRDRFVRESRLAASPVAAAPAGGLCSQRGRLGEGAAMRCVSGTAGSGSR